MAAVDKVLLASKFRGTLVGALLGDCLGAPYEDVASISKRQLQTYFDKMESTQVKGPFKPYTDDSAMTRCIAKSLIENKVVNETDIATKFVTEFYKEPNRGYGANVISVFDKLLSTKVSDPFGPALQQFNGSGSYGNGAAMRTSPIALFYFDNFSTLTSMCANVSKITHAHKLGINGAILQSLAIRKCLFLNPNEKLDVNRFATELIDEIKNVEKEEDKFNLSKYNYETQLTLMKNFFSKESPPSDEEVVTKLGNSVSSIFSVPTAIYCFLRAQERIPKIDTDNPFRRAIQYAISLGGDTDTIASMTGAIAGAFFGDEIINENLKKESIMYITRGKG
ncbi:ADP-ribosylglycohydrolase, putative [Pediculus humanus corporis]|uniref:ADP-ribosylhydrolase ARH3 n=1 Tax=Pediculus humanus subsp. corporis TaxID=121224 RepID=E0VYH2_PEDHC|nr:ADP-ribosylglycohydrolase, putative [Pediculus humanus corporis]EEB18428.1 ADP-ribosylglycohydrolase, putative [Pediculus humanus corporis]